jgi:predicted O-linked N-acetylglucosamine transferase (SPINDLY family)
MSTDPFADPELQPLVAAHRSGRLAEAEAGYRRLLAGHLDHPGAWHYLALLLWQSGRRDAALEAARSCIDADPAAPKPRLNLGVMLLDCGLPAEAAEHFLAARSVAPTVAQAAFGLGLAASALRRPEEAVERFREAITLAPDYAEAHYNLGCALKEAGDTAAAEDALRRAVALKPDYAEAFNNLANLLDGRAKPAEAEALVRQALGIREAFPEGWNTLGNTLEAQARLPEAEQAYRRAVTLRADYQEAWSNLLFTLNYQEDKDPVAVAAAHREWGKGMERHEPLPFPNPPEPRRRLRIGYVSPDFRTHSVAYFIAPVLAAHDRAAVEVFAYSCRGGGDATTRRLRDAADHWRDISGLDDAAAAESVRADGIDVLVDLAGHTASNRLPLFARRPAPVQVTWIGYPNTTGLAAIGWRLCDSVTDPPGPTDDVAAERLVRLPGCFLCYQPPSPSPQPQMRPAGCPVTFGSFNKLAKVTPGTIAAWATILARVPGSRLLVKSKQLDEPATRERLAAALAAHGIAADRLDLRGWIADRDGHLGAYGLVDIGLDTFPYNGTTTTCEAMWMGVPVVTWAGNRHAARVGASLLGTVGLTELVAADVAGYVEAAVALAADEARRQVLRSSLRQRLAGSPLCDAATFTRGVELALRIAWQDWCKNQGGWR